MPRQGGQKLKLLYLQEILRRETDEQHPLSLKQIQDLLEQRGVFAERKSLYDDMEQLRLLGEDIVTVRDTTVRYYVGERALDIAQLRLLVDAVQSSKFITKKKSEQLIRNLESLTSRHMAGELQRQVLVSGRIKHMNESIFYNVDALHSALQENRQVKFQYFDWGMDKQQHLRREGAYYQVSPWALTWDDENYYLIAYDHRTESIRHYRVDRMLRIRQTDLVREGEQDFKRLDMARHTQKTFGMFGGQSEPVTLRCSASVAGIILDRFGQDATLIPEGEDAFVVRVSVVVSPQFFGWLTGLGTAVQVQSPAAVAQQYRLHLKEILAGYSHD
ncbi:MAG: WYL domain-containing protein [Ruminococcaceae bacterium]|nr:WYL domain-containing protein [Oscillospiraceae bacterium]